MIINDEYLSDLSREVTFLKSRKVANKTCNDLNELEFEEPEKKLIIEFIAKLNSSLDWIIKCKQFEVFRSLFYIPYLHYGFDLQNKYGSNIILSNATFDNNIYNYITNQYPKPLPEIKTTLNYPIMNTKSYLLHYVYSGRSCSKTGLKDYAKDLFPIVRSVLKFCNNKRGLITGLITHKEYENYFRDNQFDFDVKDHFIGHRGKNDFDKVDLLVIFGTYNIPRIAYLMNNYAITGEYLHQNTLKEWKPVTINNVQISAPVNDKFKATRLYQLYDEHTQAIFRSGAHLSPNKTVISFGYVPPGVEKMLNYYQFTNTHQLIGKLTSIYKKKISIKK